MLLYVLLVTPSFSVRCDPMQNSVQKLELSKCEENSVEIYVCNFFTYPDFGWIRKDNPPNLCI